MVDRSIESSHSVYTLAVQSILVILEVVAYGGQDGSSGNQEGAALSE